MVWPLFKHELRSCVVPVTVVACVLALYSGAVVGMFDPELGESLETMREAMPELFAAFGMADQGSTLLEFLVSYLYGFLLVVFPFALAAMLTDRLMVRRIEQGSISYLLAQPVGRARLAASQLLVMMACLIALMAVMGAVEYVCAEALFPVAGSPPVLCRASLPRAGRARGFASPSCSPRWPPAWARGSRGSVTLHRWRCSIRSVSSPARRVRSRDRRFWHLPASFSLRWAPPCSAGATSASSSPMGGPSNRPIPTGGPPANALC